MTPTRPELDELLVDYLYDELDPAQRAAFERGLIEHPELAAEVEAHRRTRSVAASLPAIAMPAGLLDDVLAEAARVAAANAPAKGGASSAPGLFERLFRVFNQPAFAMAMVALVVVGVGMLLLDKPLPGESDPNSQRLAPATVEPAELRESEEAEPVVDSKAEGRHGVAPAPDEARDEAPALEQAVDALADESTELRNRNDKDVPEFGEASVGGGARGSGAVDGANAASVAKRAPRSRAVPDATRSAPRSALGGVASGSALDDLGARADEPMAWETTERGDEAPAEGLAERSGAGGEGPARAPRPVEESNDGKPVDQAVQRSAEETADAESEGAKAAPARPSADSGAARNDNGRRAPTQPSAPAPPPSAPAPERSTLDSASERELAAPVDDDGGVVEERDDGADRRSKDDADRRSKDAAAERVAALWKRYAELVDAGRWSDAEEVLEQLDRVEGQRERVRTSRGSLANRREAAERKATDTKEAVPQPASKPGL